MSLNSSCFTTLKSHFCCYDASPLKLFHGVKVSTVTFREALKAKQTPTEPKIDNVADIDEYVYTDT